MGRVVIACIVAVVALIFLWGCYLLLRDPREPSTEMTDTDVSLYRDAAKILNRLINVTELSGDFAVDVMSPESRKRITAWLLAYKKELDKK